MNRMFDKFSVLVSSIPWRNVGTWVAGTTPMSSWRSTNEPTSVTCQCETCRTAVTTTTSETTKPIVLPIPPKPIDEDEDDQTREPEKIAA